MMQELNYIRCGDYYIPDISLPEKNRPIGRWGRMRRDYIKQYSPIRFNDLCLSDELWTYLADLNEQAQNRLEICRENVIRYKYPLGKVNTVAMQSWLRLQNKYMGFTSSAR